MATAEIMEEEEFCPNCNQFTGGNDYCPNCGALLKSDDDFGEFQDDESSFDDEI